MATFNFRLIKRLAAPILALLMGHATQAHSNAPLVQLNAPLVQFTVNHVTVPANSR